MARYCVYILASKSRRLYAGITNDIYRRLEEHRDGKDVFTARYRINRLVFIEFFSDPYTAIRAEKVIKGWRRSKKTDLITKHNPAWDDLAPEWR